VTNTVHATYPKLFLHKFTFTLKALENLSLPEYKGSLFRGAFGITFRRVVCVTRQQVCSGCLLTAQCSYFKIFETEIPENSLPFLQNVKKVPHPFIIDPPLETKREYVAGEELEVGLTIFGEVISALPFFVFTFLKLGQTGISYKRSKLNLLDVKSVSADGSAASIYNDGKLKNNYPTISAENLMKPAEKKISKVNVQLLTPLRFQILGKIVSDPADLTPELFFTLLERRITLLSNLYCGANEAYTIPFVQKNLSLNANGLMMHDWQRYSSRQKTKMSLGGLQGSFTLEGELNELFPYLKLASFLNLGKNTVFGLGKMKVEKL